MFVFAFLLLIVLSVFLLFDMCCIVALNAAEGVMAVGVATLHIPVLIAALVFLSIILGRL